MIHGFLVKNRRHTLRNVPVSYRDAAYQNFMMREEGTYIKFRILKTILIPLCVSIFIAPAVPAFSTGPQDDSVRVHDKDAQVFRKSHRELNITGYRMLIEKRYPEAESYFLLAAQKNPASKHYHNNLAVAYMNQGKYREAYSRLQIAIALDGSYVRALSNMAVTCFHLFKFREAYTYYRKVIGIDKAYAQDRFERKRVMDRIRYLEKENPDNRELYFILQHLKLRQGDVK